MDAVELRGLTKVYRRGRRSVTVVDHLTLKVPAGIVFGFLGPNGAGKTTTIRMLCGVLAPTSGEAQVAGASLRHPDQIKARIGYANQAASVYGDLSVQENLQFKAALYLPSAEVGPAAERVMARLALEPFRHTAAAQLSGGWRQRLLIGTAIIHSPRVIFLDEPTAAVDPVGRRELWDTIYNLTADGVTVFVSTHYMEEAERCHRIAMIAGGRLLAEGRPEDIRAATPGHFYQFEPANLVEGLHRARTAPGVRGAWISGNAIRLLADGELRAGAWPAGPPPAPALPTLEDAFVALAQRAQFPDQPLPAQGVA
ncbi:ABC transporter ATP-binding protein [Deinococcus multiflagellatus]|uniref:ABC transporter ATP-binding protein n=1 Tax=Deinococcus multiflagellatus TaxID=1656887 RepID=UPI001CCF9DCB|nr:ABC transporter ATP-binding protein [Deinococcus multiflagellatus]MBZ9715050.1 ABC transporter ATP-binding protein [Deinococcus multiflagellatus]